VFDSQGAWVGGRPITYTDVPPLLTPWFVGTVGLEWVGGAASVALTGRHVAHSQLDNTGLSRFRLPSLTNLDLRASYELGGWWPGARPRLTVFANNLLNDVDQFGSGYSYQFLSRDAAGAETLDGIPFYYPLATRNIVVSLQLGF